MNPLDADSRTAQTPPRRTGRDIADLRERAFAFDDHLKKVKAQAEPAAGFWYPYGTVNNLIHLDALLHGSNRQLLDLCGDQAVADIGAADGDLAFFLEHECGLRAHVVDHAPTNYNSMRGVRRLKEVLRSQVEIHDIDLDQLHKLPEERFGLIFFLGILYHLKNPYYALESLALRARHLLLSTRVAQLSPDRSTRIADLPVAYLLHETEANNDPTNYWIFSLEGLRRIINRTGWEIIEMMTVGKTQGSDPASQEGDERAFCLLRSRRV